MSEDLDLESLEPIGSFDFVSITGRSYTMFTYHLQVNDPLKAAMDHEWCELSEITSKSGLINNLDAITRYYIAQISS